MKNTFTILSELLVSDFGVDPSIIHPKVAVSQLGLDSLTLMEFVFAAEDAFSLRIPQEKMDPTQSGLTLEAICDVIDTIKK
ncbi:MAG: phosphopantetheine-binding protein [Betaproteobacteria bacterium]